MDTTPRTYVHTPKVCVESNQRSNSIRRPAAVAIDARSCCVRSCLVLDDSQRSARRPNPESAHRQEGDSHSEGILREGEDAGVA